METEVGSRKALQPDSFSVELLQGSLLLPLQGQQVEQVVVEGVVAEVVALEVDEGQGWP